MNGVNINISQYIKNEYTTTSVPKTTEDVLNVLKSLTTGDKVTANILDISGNKVVIGLENGNSLTAMLMDNVGVNIGDTVQFEVNNSNSEQVVLKPILNETSQSNMLAQKALTAASVPINEKTTQLIMELVKNNMSISKESVQEFSRAINNFPQADAETLVRLAKLEIPITQENINQFNNYKNYEHSISSKADVLSGEVASLLENKETAMVLKDIFASPEFVSGENIKEALPKEVLVELAKFTENPETAKSLAGGDISAKQALLILLDENVELLSADKSKSSEAMKELVKAFTREQLLINPQDVAKENEIKDFYSRVLEQMDTLEKGLENAGKGTENLLKQVVDIKENVNFMNNLNHMMTYVQIPLKFTNQNVHSDLYVFRGKGQAIDKDNVSALLHLDMDNLGKMDVYVNLTNGTNVSTRFCMETEEMLDFIIEHIDILNKRLEELGYSTNIVADLGKTDHDFVKEFVDEGHTVGEISRFSFDIRA